MQGDSDSELGAAGLMISRVDVPAVCVSNGSADCQPHAGPTSSAAMKRHEYEFAIQVRNSRPLVPDADHRMPIFLVCQQANTTIAPNVGHCLDGISQEIEKNQSQLYGIAQNRQFRLGQVHHYVGSIRQFFHPQQGDGIGHEIGDENPLTVRHPTAAQRLEPSYDVRRTCCLRNDPLDTLASFLQIRRTTFQPSLCRGGVIMDSTNGLLNLVRNGGK